MDTPRFIARLTLVEVQRALARRLRTQEISAEELDERRLEFYEDLLRRRFRVKELTAVHYRSAVRLVHVNRGQGGANRTSSTRAIRAKSARFFVMTVAPISRALASIRMSLKNPR